MNENFEIAYQEIKDIINKFNLNSTEVELVLIKLRKETEYKEFEKGLHNAFSRVMIKN